MLDFGFSEILLTSAIALVVLGPERLPKVARQVGNWMGRARVMARQLSEQLEREVNAEALLKEHTQLKPPAHSVAVSATPAPLPPDVAAVSAAHADPATVSATPAPLPPDHPAAVSAAHAAPAADPADVSAAQPVPPAVGPAPAPVPDAARAPDG